MANNTINDEIKVTCITAWINRNLDQSEDEEFLVNNTS